MMYFIFLVCASLFSASMVVIMDLLPWGLLQYWGLFFLVLGLLAVGFRSCSNVISIHNLTIASFLVFVVSGMIGYNYNNELVINRLVLIFLVWFFIFELSYSIGARHANLWVRSVAPGARRTSEVSEDWFWLIVCLISVGFVVLVAALTISYGGVFQYVGKSISDRYSMGNALLFLSVYLSGIFYPAVGMGVLLLFGKHLSLTRRLVLVICIGIPFLWAYISWSRGRLIGLAIVVFAARILIMKEKRGIRTRLVLSLVLMIVMGIVVAGVYLQSTFRGLGNNALELTVLDLFTGKVEAVRLVFEPLLEILRTYPEHRDYKIAYSVYSTALALVPRSLWPSKPLGLGRLLSIEIYGNPNNGIGITLVGESYINGGYFGVLIYSLIWGWVAGYLDRYSIRRRFDTLSLGKYFTVLPSAVAMFRGAFQDALIPLLISVIAFSIIAKVVLFARRNKHE